jgi:hypothetical protein
LLEIKFETKNVRDKPKPLIEKTMERREKKIPH